MENKLYNGIINSGKTQKIIADLENKINNKESMIILDTKNEYKELFKDYEVIEFNINNLDEFEGYNPFYRATNLYKENKIDEAIGVIISIGNKIFKTKDSIDPFWDNSAKNLYTSICLYLLETNKDLTIKEIIKVAISDFDDYKDYVDKQDVLKSVSILGTPIIKAPVETRGGILSVFNQKMGYFAHRPQLLEKLCDNKDIEFKDKNQVILFTNKNQDCFVNVILEIIMLEIIDILMDNKIKYNFILDNFDTIMNNEEFNQIFNICLSNNIESIVGVRNIEKIVNKDLFKIIN